MGGATEIDRSELDAVGLPAGARACLFDLDGVLTDTASVHAAAWKQMFDDFLKNRDGREGEDLHPFDPHDDYNAYVDGKPRADGTESFLRSRNIDLPAGDDDDPPDAETVHGLGNRKNALLQQLIEEQGVRPYDGSLRYVRAVRDLGLAVAVVSSSANAAAALHSAGFDGLIDARVDGVEATRRGLKGKPDPATFLAGAQELSVEPNQAVVFEDALAGVEAGRAGRFARTVGVDRVGQADALRAHGADVVVTDLAELLVRT